MYNIVLYILYSTVGVLKHFLALETEHEGLMLGFCLIET